MLRMLINLDSSEATDDSHSTAKRVVSVLKVERRYHLLAVDAF